MCFEVLGTLQTCLYASRSNAQASSSRIIKARGLVISKTPLGLGLLQGNRSSPGSELARPCRETSFAMPGENYLDSSG
ncbi:hypothetical protein DY000_02015440 [Brassica cretica]|uniref:Uncharacterized protein n=1 Tax=Brassica cretica TaxID=69181 RepID=A0ABQ7D6B0_BRACR|nr:hypothetical protein DY000_02015440 [Brassica cretica]